MAVRQRYPDGAEGLRTAAGPGTKPIEAPQKRPFSLSFGIGDTELAGGAVVLHREDAADVQTFAKSLVNQLDASDGVHRLAFTADPTQRHITAGVYRAKTRLVPDFALKRIAVQDGLVATIVRTRQNHMSAFGRPRPDRFSTGYVIRPNPETLERLDQAGKAELDKSIAAAVKKFDTCGSQDGVPDEERSSLSEWLANCTRSAVVCGRIAADITYLGEGAQRRFHHFGCVDGGTIYRANTSDHESAEAVRRQAYDALCQIAGKKDLVREARRDGKRAMGAYVEDYVWVQVIEGRPVQAFTSEELKCQNFYPVPDVEMDGYPVTPIDTAIQAITTHINLTTHNKLYFQSGRAAKGMVVISSDDVTPQAVSQIKQQFNASINSVQNSHRMPVFGVATGDTVTWQPMDTGGGRDMEFQYLSDMNAREILSAFMMSPDELPGWSYLSKGTNSQALSDSNNEYKLEAARDVGIRPLIAQFEDFINTHLFPLLDAELARQCRFKFVGLDADNPEKEGVLLEAASKLHLTYDDILEKVEKKPVGRQMGGALPLNPDFVGHLDKYFTVGEILEFFCDRKDASKQPELAWRNNPLWLQWWSTQQQMAQAQQAAQQAPPGGQPPPDGGQGGQGGPQPGPGDTDAGPPTGAQQLARSVDQAIAELKKGEAQLPAQKRRLLAQADKTVDFFMKGFLRDSKEALDAIAEIADQATGKRR